VRDKLQPESSGIEEEFDVYTITALLVKVREGKYKLLFSAVHIKEIEAISDVNELPRRKQRGIKNFKFCHSALDAESSPVFWIPASAGMTNSPQAAGNTTRRD
jgi:hypothetical protein